MVAAVGLSNLGSTWIIGLGEVLAIEYGQRCSWLAQQKDVGTQAL